MKQKQNNIPRIKILPTSQARESGRRREDDKGQKEDRMWHRPPLQIGRPGQVMHFRTCSKEKGQNVGLRKCHLGTKECKVFKFKL